MDARERSLFQIWKVYQRRAESLAHYFDMDIVYYHYPWEEKSKIFKAISYILKSINTVIDLLKFRPRLIFIQLPPTPALYLIGVYARLTHTPYVADCHNAMLLDWWIHWPFAKSWLKKATAVLVHNQDVCDYANRYGINAMVVRDPLPQISHSRATGVVKKFDLDLCEYVIVPWNLASDEPIAEFIEAVRMLPHIKFAMTWFTERLPEELGRNLPENLIFTGYLDIDEFNDLFVNAGSAISLTMQKGTQPSAAAEAIAFGVPIILTESETARLLYKDVPVYVENNPSSIANGITEVFAQLSKYTDKVVAFKSSFERELEEEVDMLKSKIG